MGALPIPATLSYRINTNRKKENIIILITKQESIELQKLGHRFGSEGTLHRTHSKYKKYFLTESKRALADLDKIRKSRITEK